MKELFDSINFMPHGHCYLWNPGLVWLHATSDTLIALSYYSIPISLYYFIRRRPNFPFRTILALFAVFIAACGTTHIMEVWSLWNAAYWLSGGIKALTAIASITTAIVLVPLIPRALQLRSHAELEAEVQQRTRQLEVLNHQLRLKTNYLQESNRELEQFAYVASHDLKEPLRKIATHAQALGLENRGKLGSESERTIGTIVNSVARLNALIDDLLAYSRVRRGAAKLEEVAMDGILRQVVSDLEPVIKESGAVISHDPLPTIKAIPFQMYQLFLNLINNAIKFRHNAVPVIHVTADPVGDSWRFAVRDNGIGIDPKHKDQIFKIFHRLHTRDKYPGTGIGLAVCKRVVANHGGDIWVESDAGHGATFFFTVQVDQAAVDFIDESIPTVLEPED